MREILDTHLEARIDLPVSLCIIAGAGVGSILVCVMTNPAWTSLFAHATGLVTDIGGVISHGSIVAREYGIPAVVGTGDSTQRIKHGQMITVDGDAGTVELHEN